MTAVGRSADRSFGNVLDDGARRASGDVLLKMDDDDWYGPDFVTDLLLARGYSGADLVGCPPEFLFVEPLWVTVRRRDATERYTSVVAGGTMMVSRRGVPPRWAGSATRASTSTPTCSVRCGPPEARSTGRTASTTYSADSPPGTPGSLDSDTS